MWKNSFNTLLLCRLKRLCDIYVLQERIIYVYIIRTTDILVHIILYHYSMTSVSLRRSAVLAQTRSMLKLLFKMILSKRRPFIHSLVSSTNSHHTDPLRPSKLTFKERSPRFWMNSSCFSTVRRTDFCIPLYALRFVVHSIHNFAFHIFVKFRAP